MNGFVDFAEKLRDASDAEAAFRVFEDAVRTLGFKSIDYGTGTIPRWPVTTAAEWQLEYFRATFHWEHEYPGEFQTHDRSIPHSANRLTPWLYWDLFDVPPQTDVQRRMEAYIQSKVRSGLGIPLHGPGGRFAAAHLGSDLSKRELQKLDRETRPTVFLLAALFNARLEQVVPDRSAQPALAPRERECLAWAAVGKTAWETSMILSISESAVKKHLASAARKLGARTRTQAVATALCSRLIEP